MVAPSEKDAARLAQELLVEWFDTRPATVHEQVERLDFSLDLVVELGPHVLVLEYKRSGDVGSVSRATQQLGQHTLQKEIPVVVVPYMGAKGMKHCAREGVSWMDLSGNAHIRGEDLLIHVEGNSNRFGGRGRRSSPFAPKSSRIARFLLAHPYEYFQQKTVAQRTDLGQGYTSKIVSRLEDRRLVQRDAQRRVGTEEPELLLDAWEEDYDFSKHAVTKGTIAARDSIELTRRIAVFLEQQGLAHAATGLAAAWFFTEFARFRTVSFYLNEPLTEDAKQNLGLREDPRGANVWLISPKDEGVFQETEQRQDIRCVHPVQAYLDLRGHPERSAEAAETVRKLYLDRAKRADD